MAHIRSLFFGGPLSDIQDKTMAAYRAGRPSEVIWNITDACNLLCEHCYVGATHEKAERELTDEEAVELTTQIGLLKVPLLFLTGGEPLLRRNVFDILAIAHGHGTRTVISTNGTLVNAHTAALLRAHGLDYAAISLYGPKEFHDAYVRVDGAYARSVRGIEHLRDYGVKVCIKTSVNRATWPHVRGVIQTAKDVGAGIFYPCDLITAGRSHGAREQRVSAAEWRELADFMLEDVLADETGMEYDIGAMPSVAPYLAQRLIERGHDANGVIDRLGSVSSCPVGCGLVNISAEGDILPCAFASDYRVGNIRHMDLSKAVRVLSALVADEVGGACGDCRFSRICRGCRTKAWHDCGDLQAADPTCILHAPAVDPVRAASVL